MAVPKQKQSHARTTQRRSQHKISAPTYNACPQCHSPRLPHRVCPVCGSYKGREVIVSGAGRADRLSAAPWSPSPWTRAGRISAPRGRGGRRARGRRWHPGAAVRSGRGDRPRPGGVEVVDAPVSIAKQADPALRRPHRRPRRRSCRPRARWPRAAPRRSCPADRRARRSPPRLFNLRRDRGVYRPALALPLPEPGRLADPAARRGGQRRPAAPSTWSSSPTWARPSPRR